MCVYTGLTQTPESYIPPSGIIYDSMRTKSAVDDVALCSKVVCCRGQYVSVLVLVHVNTHTINPPRLLTAYPHSPCDEDKFTHANLRLPF